jgi:hypothetical protein
VAGGGDAPFRSWSTAGFVGWVVHRSRCGGRRAVSASRQDRTHVHLHPATGTAGAGQGAAPGRVVPGAGRVDLGRGRRRPIAGTPVDRAGAVGVAGRGAGKNEMRPSQGAADPDPEATNRRLHALLWANPTCSAHGCPGNRIEWDHQKPWADTKHTRLDELDPLCALHHDLKTRLGYALVAGTGKRPFVPPDHPTTPDTANPQATVHVVPGEVRRGHRAAMASHRRGRCDQCMRRCRRCRLSLRWPGGNVVARARAMPLVPRV